MNIWIFLVFVTKIKSQWRGRSVRQVCVYDKNSDSLSTKCEKIIFIYSITRSKN